MRKILAASVLCVCAACASSDDSNGLVQADAAPNRTISVEMGDELDLLIQNVGPGQFDDPTVSTGSVEFVAQRQTPVVVPAGATQVFRFRTKVKGMAVVTFVKSSPNQTVTDTVYVR